MLGAGRTDVAVFVAALAVYTAFAWPRLPGPSRHDHHLRQAQAWLSGALDLGAPPPHRNDWASLQELRLHDGRVLSGVWRGQRRPDGTRRFQTVSGATQDLPAGAVRAVRTRWFVSFPPFPALLLLPFVAVFGLAADDVLLTVVLAALNVALLRRLLGRLGARLPREDLALTCVFALGTAHLWCGILGEVWFTSQIVGVACGLLFLLAVEADRPGWAGVALAGALATRPHLALLGLYWPLRRGWRPGPLARAAIAPALCAGLLALHNVARFGRPWEFGHTWLAGGALPAIVSHGLFDPAFLPRNLAAALALLPRLHGDAPFVAFSRHGMALWFSTPVLLWALPAPAPAGGDAPHPARRPLAWAAIAVALPPLLYQSTGYEQFGWRYSLDWTAPAFALIALSGRPLGAAFRAAAAWGVAVAVVGALIFKRAPALFDDHLFVAPPG